MLSCLMISSKEVSHHFLRRVVAFFEVFGFAPLGVSISSLLRQSIAVCNSCFVNTGMCSLLFSRLSLSSTFSELSFFCDGCFILSRTVEFSCSFFTVLFFVIFRFLTGRRTDYCKTSRRCSQYLFLMPQFRLFRFSFVM